MKKVCALIVTYNRKKLLVECISSLLQQKYQDFDILIIDNCSTDGTYEEIASFLENKNVFYYNTNANLGGAGGFNFALKKALSNGYDYYWIMDDDTIPEEDALLHLLNSANRLNNNFGYLSSSVLWTDRNACKMNLQKLSRNWYHKLDLLDCGILPIKQASFVSLFLSKEVILELGLPIKDFFIWGDDVEYTQRISKKYNCYLVGSSKVIHKTAVNSGSNIALDDNRIDRYKFAYRNEIYIAKTNGLKGFCYQTAKIILHTARVLCYAKNQKLKRLKIIYLNSVIGLFFNPKIEYFKDGENND